MKYIFGLACLILSSTVGFAQKILPEHLRFAENMKVLFSESKVASIEHSSAYTFDYEKSSGSLSVKALESRELVALEYNAEHIESSYFNEQVKINSYSVKNAKGRSVSIDKFCGHYSSNGIFHSDAQVCAYNIPINTKGEYRKFSSSSTFKDPKYLTSAYFHTSLPAAKRVISFKVPSWVDIELREMNFDNYDIKKNIREEGKYTVTSFEISNLDKYPEGSNLPGSSYYMPHILILTKGYTWQGTKYDVLSSTESLYKWYKSLVGLSKLNAEELEPLVNDVIEGSSTDEEKIKAIYYWVQDNIKYIAFEDGLAGFKPEDSDQVYAKKYGDCKGMANLTKDMLRIAGFDARLSWIGTNRIAYTYDIPSLAVDNHMICALKMDDKFMFLDATEKHHSFEEYAERLQGKQVLIEDGDSFIIKKIPVEGLDKYLNTTQVEYLYDGKALTAKATEDINGEFKRGLINLYNAIPNQKLGLFYKSIVAGDLETANVDILNEPSLERDSTLQLKYNLSLKNQLNQFGDEVYIDLDYKKDLKGSEIEKDREVPYKFSSKINRQLSGSLIIPEDMKVSHLPKSYEVNSDYFEFTLNYEVTGNKINYNKKLKVLNTFLPVDQFTEWNKAIKNITQFYNDQIILTAK